MSSSLRLPLIFVLFLFALGLCSLRVEAGVAVLANNTDAPVRFEIIDSDGKQQGFMLDRSDVIPIACPEQIGIVFGSNGTQRRYLLRSNTINYIAKADNSLDLRTLLLPAPPDEDRNLPPPKPRNIPHAILTIPVKILADDDQPAVQRVWEREFRDRIDTASTIFEHHCGIRFEVKAVETWTSNNRITEFDESLREFETKVNPAPAKVAIGFTSQYAIPHGFTHLGGTRGPIHSHILIREWSQHVTRSERLEILIHELGHLYGASHSADPASVMRPRLGDRRSNSASFRIGFDPLNTLALNLIADELRSTEYHGFALMPLDTKRELQRIYLALDKELPNDPAAAHFLKMLHMPIKAASPLPDKPPELITATQDVVQAVVEAARVNRTAITELKGDGMTEYLVRRAAAQALKHPPDIAPKAFLLGIGVALDDSELWRDFRVLSNFCHLVESDEARQRRLSQLGKTTMQGRHDLAQHFVVSCALAVPLGPSGAEQAGIVKEISDAHGASGFSFADLSADVAGATFAAEVLKGNVTLEYLADSYRIRDFMPQIDSLEEGISWDEFTVSYGSISDDRYQEVRSDIQKRIQSLPGYKKDANLKR